MTDARADAMDCARVDDLAGAAALDALEQGEARAVADHLATCDRPHAELRELLGAGAVLSAALEPVAPHPAVRARVMASVTAAAQEHRAPQVAATEPADAAPAPPAGGWFGWPSLRLARGLLAAAAVVIIALGAWNIGLRQQMAVRDAALAAIADVVLGGQPAYAVSGPAGSGYVVDSEGPGATFLVAGLAELPAGDIYELWLLDAAGTPLAVGTIEDVDAELAVVALEQDLTGFAVFAVTVEAERVEAPTGDPVIAGAILN